MDPEVPFRVDQTFSLGSDFKVAGDTYADHNNFVIRINNSKYFVEEEIAKAKECGKPLPSDLLKYVQLTCSRGGKLKKKKTTLLDTYDDDDFQAPKVKKTRNRKSENCGCAWAVSASWDFGIALFRLVSVHLEHTNGCNPNPAQQRVMLRKKNKGED